MVLLKSTMVPLGTAAPGFNLKGVDGEVHSLSDYDSAKVLVVIFMCNHCPYVQEIWDDLISLEKELRGEVGADVQFLGINSNANPDYPDDSFEKMKEYVKEKGQEFPYLFDETQEVGKAYDAQCTPDIFVYDKERKLSYRGAFSGLGDAVRLLLKGEKPAAKQDYSMGCSIKWTS